MVRLTAFCLHVFAFISFFPFFSQARCDVCGAASMVHTDLHHHGTIMATGKCRWCLFPCCVLSHYIFCLPSQRFKFMFHVCHPSCLPSQRFKFGDASAASTANLTRELPKVRLNCPGSCHPRNPMGSCHSERATRTRATRTWCLPTLCPAVPPPPAATLPPQDAEHASSGGELKAN
jgi:hypothetical protein